MPVVSTDAVVLHILDYLETSRIVRLATREVGVQSVLARGARRPRTRYGSALDLFAGGTAELVMKPGRELHTLTSFDVTRGRPELAADLARFTGASALAELVLRCSGEETHPALFDVLVDALDGLASASGNAAIDVALASAWRIVSELGFAPALKGCARCDAPVAGDATVPFSHRAGGVLCPRCARLEPVSRQLPGGARLAIGAWLAGTSDDGMGDAERRAHQRLLREFLREHLADGRSLRAFEVWERERWDAGAGAPA
jgi:DNA repair protein RecO (recombination protein O)